MKDQAGPLRKGHKKQTGFTLVELVIVVSIIAVLLVAAAPNLRLVIQNNRATALANELSVAINYARSEAVKRGAEVMVCPSSDQTTCTGSWTDGWIVVPAAGGGSLRVWQSQADFDAIITQTPTANEPIRFDALGGRASTATTLNAGVAECRGERARRIDVGLAGRVSILMLDCSELQS